jgi:hypothetical protein
LLQGKKAQHGSKKCSKEAAAVARHLQHHTTSRKALKCDAADKQ